MNICDEMPCCCQIGIFILGVVDGGLLVGCIVAGHIVS